MSKIDDINEFVKKFKIIYENSLKHLDKDRYFAVVIGDVYKNREQYCANFKYIFLSYNNEGLMNEDEVKNIMTKYGSYDLKTKEYQRFKADKTENRNHKANMTYEYLHILEKK